MGVAGDVGEDRGPARPASSGSGPSWTTRGVAVAVARWRCSLGVLTFGTPRQHGALSQVGGGHPGRVADAVTLAAPTW